jgi:hypothetical protein
VAIEIRAHLSTNDVLDLRGKGHLHFCLFRVLGRTVSVYIGYCRKLGGFTFEQLHGWSMSIKL